MGIRAQGNPLASFADLWSQTGLDAASGIPIPEGPTGHTATGGVISDWADPGSSAVYRLSLIHI